MSATSRIFLIPSPDVLPADGRPPLEVLLDLLRQQLQAPALAYADVSVGALTFGLYRQATRSWLRGVGRGESELEAMATPGATAPRLGRSIGPLKALVFLPVEAEGVAS